MVLLVCLLPGSELKNKTNSDGSNKEYRKTEVHQVLNAIQNRDEEQLAESQTRRQSTAKGPTHTSGTLFEEQNEENEVLKISTP
jgi:hypothetical protein